MANIIGMDVEAVEQLSRDLHTQADAIGDIVSKIDNLINHMHGIWKGNDATQFDGWWKQQHRPALVKAQSAIDGLSRSAHYNASEQSQVSSR